MPQFARVVAPSDVNEIVLGSDVFKFEAGKCQVSAAERALLEEYAKNSDVKFEFAEDKPKPAGRSK
jgi:hypothetical protein